MATLASIEKQIAKLIKEKEAILRSEAKAAARQARDLIEKFGLTAVDLGLGKKTRAAKAGVVVAAKRAAKAVAAPKYRDPATGKTWTGRGKPPNWIAGAKDRGQFLIADEGLATTGAVGSKKAAKVPTKKATRKAAAAPKSGPRKKAVAAPATDAASGKVSAKKNVGRAAAKRSAKPEKTAAAVSTSGAAGPQAVQ